MLKAWQTSVSAEDDFDLSGYGLSKLDDPQIIEEITGLNSDHNLHADLTSKNQNSVNWAIANLYNKSAFKPDWSTELTHLSSSPGFRSIQVASALKLHLQTMILFKTFALKQFRSYLFLFDIVVQNGGIPESGMTNIINALKASPHWSETQKLKAILIERLKYVKKAYVKDVQSRKASIINGGGNVHGERRNYAKEYCANLSESMP